MSPAPSLSAQQIAARVMLRPVEEWPAILDRECSGDSVLRAEVEAILHMEPAGRDTELLEAGQRALKMLLDDEPIEGLPPNALEAWEELIQRLDATREASSRFEERGQVAQGGIGAILRVFDPNLRRVLAKKILLPQPQPATDDERQEQQRRRSRFLEEAQVTAQLDHPGVVPVHEIGLDSQRRLFFTMRLVRGSDLRAIFDKVRNGEDGWNRTRVLSVLLKVCETMAYAHSKRVIHRDLKPANIMIGRFGETYVMDWGLARMLDQPDHRDLRIRPRHPESISLETELHRSGSPANSPLVTMDGAILGTPMYMAPEQAHGELDRVGPASDVYAIGAILYELLAGHMPYMHEDHVASAHTILSWVQYGPPRSLKDCGDDLPAELCAICDKAMQRSIGRRYPSMIEMAEDLRAYLENRVVRAHRTGAVIELRKWVKRNRGFAAALVVILILTVSGGFIVGWQQSLRSSEHARAQRVADVRAADGRAQALLRAADALWPLTRSDVPRMKDWIDEAERLLAAESLASTFRDELRRRGRRLPDAPGLTQELGDLRTRYLQLAREGEDYLKTLTDPSAKLEPIERTERDARIQRARQSSTDYAEKAEQILVTHPPRPLYEFDLPTDASDYESAERLIAALATLRGEAEGSISAVRSRIAAMERAIQTSSPDRPDSGWSEAIATVSAATHPRYQGRISLTPQSGLVPLRQDPQSSLQEFWLVLSGERPAIKADGGYDLEADTGIVLVLMPGRDVVIPFKDGEIAVALRPYFLSKYEMTQSQWVRLTGANPSEHFAGDCTSSDPMVRDTNPVEYVSWDDASRYLPRWGLSLPSEAEWEVAAATPSTSPLRLYGGLIDLATAQLYNFFDSPAGAAPDQPLFAQHVVVDALTPNANGFLNIFGNVQEWCVDHAAQGPQFTPLASIDGTFANGAVRARKNDYRANRGLSMSYRAERTQRSTRLAYLPSFRNEDTGVRPAFELHTR